MPSREDVYIEARRWVDTPFHHQGRRRQQSCDCLGLIIGVARALGMACPPDREIPEYGMLPHNHMAEAQVSKLTSPASMPIRIGQIGMFWYRDRGHGQHFCIFGRQGKGRTTMIHSYFNIGKVVETGISEFWRKRLIRTFDYREIADA